MSASDYRSQVIASLLPPSAVDMCRCLLAAQSLAGTRKFMLRAARLQ